MSAEIIKLNCGRYNVDFSDDGRIFNYNEALCALTGYSPESFDTGEIRFFSLIPPEDITVYMAKLEPLILEGGGVLEHRLLCADGRKIDVICIGHAYISERGHHCGSVTVSDVSDRAELSRENMRSRKEINALIGSIPGGVAVNKIVGTKLLVLSANEEYYNILRTDDKNGLTELFSSEDRLNFINELDRCLRDGRPFGKDMKLDCHGERKWIHLRARYFDHDEDGCPLLYCTVTDITERKVREHKLQKQSLCLKMISENTDEIFFDYDAETDEIEFTANKDRYDISKASVKGFMSERRISRNIHPQDCAAYCAVWKSALSGPTAGNIDFRTKTFDKDYRWYRMAYVSVAGDNGRVANVYGMLTGIEHIKNMMLKIDRDREEIERLSNTDPVTGLYNRSAFMSFAPQALKELYSEDECFAIGYSDINDFSYINENFGYDEGNRILYDFAEIIRNCGISVIGCRIYSDYFVSLYRAKDRETMVKEIAKRNKAFTEMQKVKFPMSEMQISCGLYFIKSADDDIDIAVDNANLARRSIKNSKDAPSGVYSERMRNKRSHDQAIASEIWTAMNTDAIELFLQPKFDMESRTIIGAEALARWRNNDGSFKLPYEFIDVLENVGYITQLDMYIYEKVLQYFKKWKAEGKKLLPISVNFSRRHNNCSDYVERVNSLAEKYGADKSLLELEVTESCFTQDVKNLISNMKKFRELGFKIDIDDFGTGYSSLSILMDAPIDVVKVDKAFIDNIENSEKAREYVSQICSLIKCAQKEIIFEGVETDKQADILCGCGHRMAQGWLFEKAIPVKEFERRYL